jgi:hypothetical protein
LIAIVNDAWRETSVTVTTQRPRLSRPLKVKCVPLPRERSRTLRPCLAAVARGLPEAPSTATAKETVRDETRARPTCRTTRCTTGRTGLAGAGAATGPTGWEVTTVWPAPFVAVTRTRRYVSAYIAPIVKLGLRAPAMLTHPAWPSAEYYHA